ncbi:hypothetical protein Pta02_75220 [Planobispora takensis]|uniref:Uncharacterized protein n=1 Tax=Planobispora takensis TaxID=1367882 RepID=A0A8J3WX01_9ACTN|nr:hypothetical protein Pta02_75220 [Planobispora takensis]
MRPMRQAQPRAHRRYRLGLDPVGTRVKDAAAGTSKPAISRRFIAATERALAARADERRPIAA